MTARPNMDSGCRPGTYKSGGIEAVRPKGQPDSMLVKATTVGHDGDDEGDPGLVHWEGPHCQEGIPRGIVWPSGKECFAKLNLPIRT